MNFELLNYEPNKGAAAGCKRRLIKQPTRTGAGTICPPGRLQLETITNRSYMLPLRYLLSALLCLSPFFAPALLAQITLEQGNIEAFSDDCPLYCRPGVRNRSQSRGVVVRYENQLGFDWNGNGSLAGGRQRVERVEQFTFKFKVPLVNQPQFKALLGYEWDTEKYFFENPFTTEEKTLFQLLDDRRLKASKLSAYVTRSWNERFYTSARLRMSLSGDYDGLISFDDIYRTYSGALALGKKVSTDEEWAVGITFSSNKARAIALPFFVWNKTFNDRWGLQTALPGQAFVRRNVGADRKNAFLFGATFDSRYYAINTDQRPQYQELGPYFLRNNGVRIQLQYEHNITTWVWAFAQAGYYAPVTTRFNRASAIDVDLETTAGGRPFFRLGVFLAPPKELIR